MECQSHSQTLVKVIGSRRNVTDMVTSEDKKHTRQDQDVDNEHDRLTDDILRR